MQNNKYNNRTNGKNKQYNKNYPRSNDENKHCDSNRKAMLDEYSRKMNTNPPLIDTHFIVTIVNGELLEIKTAPDIEKAERYANAMLLHRSIALNYSLKWLLENGKAQIIAKDAPVKKAWIKHDDNEVGVYVTKLMKSLFDRTTMVAEYDEYMAAI